MFAWALTGQVLSHRELQQLQTLPPWVLRTVLIYYSGSMGPLQFCDIDNSESTFVGNARSVWMLKSLQAMARGMPGKRLLHICGAFHAKDIHYFLAHPKALEKRWKQYTGLYWTAEQAKKVEIPLERGSYAI